MAKKYQTTTKLSCTDCGEGCSVTHRPKISPNYCAFCGEEAVLEDEEETIQDDYEKEWGEGEDEEDDGDEG